MGEARGVFVLVNLNCYPRPASATNPGYSAADNLPAAAAVRDAVAAQQAQSEAEVTAENER